ncbi:MAG: hypothetical protein RLZZ26_549 [Candidatus Parcubacteria bacterium]
MAKETPTAPAKYRVTGSRRFGGGHASLIDAEVHDSIALGTRHDRNAKANAKDVWHLTYGPRDELTLLAAEMNSAADTKTALDKLAQWRAKRKRELRNGQAVRA